MRRTSTAVALGLVATLAGLGACSGSGDSARSQPTTRPRPATTTRAETSSPSTPASSTPAPPDQTLLVWTSGGLPPGLADHAAGVAGVTRVAVVLGDDAGLVASFDAGGQPVDVAPSGLQFPLDALAIDPGTYAPFVAGDARPHLESLEPGQALLGTTSARLRRIGPGGTLELVGGMRLTVAGVVDDAAVGAAELVVPATGADAVGVRTPRFLLVSYSGDRAATEQAIVAGAPGRPVRFRAPGESRYLRHADLVLPQAEVKAQFGEFAYQPGSDRFFTVDPAWESEHIVTADAPIVGSIRCHRAVIPAIQGALAEAEQRGLASLVDPAGYQGCFVPNGIPGGGLSRHSWGIAIDLNFVPNPTGLASFADPALIEVFERWGFISGARFLTVDPGHFEYVRAPR